MWLALGGNPPAPEPQTRSISAAPVVPAPPTAVAPAAEALPSTPPVPARSDEDQVRETLEAWRQAWSNRDSAAYLSHYSPDFAPPDGQNRTEWAAARRKNLASRTDISVQIHALQIERIAGDQMKLSFLQDYASGSYREKAQAKTLRMIRQDADWLIAGEWQGSPPAAR
jgi:ketosteroid isomerase-like protein